MLDFEVNRIIREAYSKVRRGKRVNEDGYVRYDPAIGILNQDVTVSAELPLTSRQKQARENDAEIEELDRREKERARNQPVMTATTDKEIDRNQPVMTAAKYTTPQDDRISDGMKIAAKYAPIGIIGAGGKIINGGKDILRLLAANGISYGMGYGGGYLADYLYDKGKIGNRGRRAINTASFVLSPLVASPLTSPLKSNMAQTFGGIPGYMFGQDAYESDREEQESGATLSDLITGGGNAIQSKEEPKRPMPPIIMQSGVYPCSLCDKAFTSENYLKRHYKLIHNCAEE